MVTILNIVAPSHLRTCEYIASMMLSGNIFLNTKEIDFQFIYYYAHSTITMVTIEMNYTIAARGLILQVTRHFLC